MQYLVRHKTTGNFINSGHNKNTVQDVFGMVPIANARLFPTIKGAHTSALWQSELITSHSSAFGNPPLPITDLEIVEATISVGAVVKTF